MAYVNPFATAPPTAGSSGYSNPFAKPSAAAPAPATPVVRTTNTDPAAASSGIPASALKGSLGGGYGASNITDPASGKPLLTYENPSANSSQLLSDRTAPSFDPTVPQKIDPASLQDPRMKESVSQSIKTAIGGSTYDELDHIMPLELGGSNNKSNLRLEGGDNPFVPYGSGNPTPTDPLENSVADQVLSGKISLVDGWKLMAQAKGFTLPEQGGAVPNINTPQTQLNTSRNPLTNANNFVQKTATPIANELGFQAIVHPIQTVKAIGDKVLADGKAAVENLFTSAAQVVADAQEDAQGKSWPEKLVSGGDPKTTGAVLNLFSAAASTLFVGLGITPVFDVAQQLPVIKPAADAVGLIFNAAGKLVSYDAGSVMDDWVAAGMMKQSTADALKEPVQNFAGLLGQVILGGAVYEKVTGAMEAKPEGISETDGQKIADEVTNQAEELKNSPELKKAQGTTADVTTGKPSEVNLREQPKQGGTPVQDIKPPKTLSDEVVQPEKPTGSSATTPGKAVAESPSDEIVKTRTVNRIRPIEGTGDIKTAKASESMEAAAIQNKLVKSLEDLPQSKSIDMNDQAIKVQKLIEDDPQGAKEIAMGKRNAPTGIIPEAVWRAFGLQATANGDGELANDLAHSDLMLQDTTMGRRINALKGVNPEDPVQAIRDLQDARAESLKKQSATESKSFDDSVQKAKADRVSVKVKMNWSQFLDTITC